MLKIITEGKAKIKIFEEKKISKKLPIFYNPIMKFNRDISILLLNSRVNNLFTSFQLSILFLISTATLIFFWLIVFIFHHSLFYVFLM